MRRVIDAFELDGKLHVVADCGKGCTHAIELPAGSTRPQIRAALRTQLDEQENRERRKNRRADLLGDL